MNAVSAVADTTGALFGTGGGISVVTFTFVFDVGAGNVTGTVYLEATSRTSGTVASTDLARVLLPAGSLHTSLSTVALSTPVSATLGSTTVTLTAATTGAFMISVSDVPAGQMRAVWDYASGTGASPNTVTCWVTGHV